MIVSVILGICLLIMALTNRNLTDERNFYKSKAVGLIKRTRARKDQLFIENELAREYISHRRKK